MRHLKITVLMGTLLCSALFIGESVASADYKDILDSVKQSIDSDSTLGSHDINITYRQKSVILKGTVASETSRRRIVQIAENTEGVKDVTDWLTVTPGGMGSAPLARYETPAARSDSEIAADIRAAIASDSRTVAEKVTVAVRNGTATLSGDMGNFREVDQVLSTALMVSGVQDISSEMTIHGRPYQMQKVVR